MGDYIEAKSCKKIILFSHRLYLQQQSQFLPLHMGVRSRSRGSPQVASFFFSSLACKLWLPDIYERLENIMWP